MYVRLLGTIGLLNPVLLFQRVHMGDKIPTWVLDHFDKFWEMKELQFKFYYYTPQLIRYKAGQEMDELYHLASIVL